MVVMSAPANPYPLPARPLRAREPDRALSEDPKPRSKLHRARRQGRVLQAAAVPGGLGGALSRPARMGAAVGRRQGDRGRCRRRRRSSTEFGTPQGRRRQRHPAAARRRASPQRAGVADRTGWCPIDPVTFESRLQPGVHVIGDAAIAGAMPKSAFAANAQAKACAAAVAALLRGRDAAGAEADQHLLQPGRARLRHLGRRRLPAGRTALLADVEGAGGVSPLDAPPRVPRARGGLCARPGSSTDHRAKCSAEDAGAVLRCAALRRRGLRPLAGGGAPARALRGRRRRHPGTRSPARRATRRAAARSSPTGRTGLCLLCHAGPFPEERFQGTSRPTSPAPARAGREGQLRLRIVDSRPAQPGHDHAVLLPHRRPRRGSAPAWRGKPILTAERDRGRGGVPRDAAGLTDDDR